MSLKIVLRLNFKSREANKSKNTFKIWAIGTNKVYIAVRLASLPKISLSSSMERNMFASNAENYSGINMEIKRGCLSTKTERSYVWESKKEGKMRVKKECSTTQITLTCISTDDQPLRPLQNLIKWLWFFGFLVPLFNDFWHYIQRIDIKLMSHQILFSVDLRKFFVKESLLKHYDFLLMVYLGVYLASRGHHGSIQISGQKHFHKSRLKLLYVVQLLVKSPTHACFSFEPSYYGKFPQLLLGKILREKI